MNPNKTKSVDDVIKELEDMDLNVICKDDCKHKIHTLQLTNEGFAVFQDAISYLHRAKVMSEALNNNRIICQDIHYRLVEKAMKQVMPYPMALDDIKEGSGRILRACEQALQQFKGDAK